MLDNKKNQSIVFLGVSGSGKTEAQKAIIKFFNNGVGVSTMREDHNKYIEMVLSSLQILEAFGNVSTTYNSNSSRYMQKTKLFFDCNGLVVGSKISTSLFEKNRVVGDFGKGETNFRIFYQLVTGASKEEKRRLSLSPANFKYLNCTESDLQDTEEMSEFKVTESYFESARFSKLEIANIHQVLATILHIGNLTFDSLNGSTVISSKNTLKIVSNLMGCKEDDIETVFCSPTLITNGNARTVKLTKEKAKVSADFLVKLMYGQLFDWISLRINKTIAPKEKSFSYTLNILDYKGFENNYKNKNNDIEQLCTNYFNDFLQSKFVSSSQKPNTKDNIKSKVDVCKNELKSFFENFDQVFKLSNLKEGSTLTQFGIKDCLKFSQNGMTVFHAHGKVLYNTEKFVEKNKEVIFVHLVGLVSKSDNVFIRNLFALNELKKNFQKSTLSSKISQKIAHLNEKLDQTKVSFIYCLSNVENPSEGTVSNSYFLSQIKNSEIIQLSPIKAKFYTQIIPSKKFIMKYRTLLPKQVKITETTEATREFTNKIIKVLFFNSKEVERTLFENDHVMLMESSYAFLENKRITKMKESASYLLKFILRYRFRTRVIEIGKVALNRKRELQKLKSSVDYPFKGCDASEVRNMYANVAISLVTESIKIFKCLKTEVIQRQSILYSISQTLAYLKQFSKEAPLVSPNLNYLKAVQQVKKALVNFCEKIKEVLRANRDEVQEKLSEINHLHNEISISVKNWRLMFGEQQRFLFDLATEKPKLHRSISTESTSEKVERTRTLTANRISLGHKTSSPNTTNNTNNISPTNSPIVTSFDSPLSSPFNSPVMSSIMSSSSEILNYNESYSDTPRKGTEMKRMIGMSSNEIKDSLNKLEQETTREDLKRENAIVVFTLSDGNNLRIKCSTSLTAQRIKSFVLERAMQFKEVPSKDTNDYIFKVYGLDFLIDKQNVQLKKLSFLKLCNETFVSPMFEMVHNKIWERCPKELLNMQELEVDEILLQNDISLLIGTELKPYLEQENEAITEFRCLGTSTRLEILKNLELIKQEDDAYVLHEYKGTVPKPLEVPQQITVQCYLPTKREVVTTIMFSENDDVIKIRNSCVDKYEKFGENGVELKYENFILKVTGLQSFLLSGKMLDFDYVRDRLCKKKSIILSLVVKEEIMKLYPHQKIPTFGVVDKILASIPTGKNFNNTNCLFVSENNEKLSRPWKVKITGCQGIPETNFPMSGLNKGENWYIFIELNFLHGNQSYFYGTTQIVKAQSNVRWSHTLFTMPIKNIPRGVVLNFVLKKFVTDEGAKLNDIHTVSAEVIGWANIPAFDCFDELASDLKALNLWPDSSISTMCSSNVDSTAIKLFIHFEKNDKPIIHPKYPEIKIKISENSEKNSYNHSKRKLEEVLHMCIFSEITTEQISLIWKFRFCLKDDPKYLPIFLQSIKYTSYEEKLEGYYLMNNWAEIDHVQALELISGKFLDPYVRKFAVSKLEGLTDGEVLDYMPQLCQALRYEKEHHSPLALFLVKRALQNRHRIGHYFYWMLKSEMHLPKVAERHGLLLEAYLRGCQSHRVELNKQNKIIQQLVKIATEIKEVSFSQRQSLLLELLGKMKLPETFQLPLDPRYEVKGLIVEKCRFMDSKKSPLWLVFENAEKNGKPITVMFKHGDDLRQDTLTIQMLRLMDKLWKEAGMDLGMQIYGCTSTGDEIGMIEIVMNSATTAKINKEAGGASKVLAENTLKKWLRSNNETEKRWEIAQDNFVRSCAAYCVATYVLGIGDRHNDNIMVTKDGCFFHIDFGHFLGNFKKKFGIKRERAPFIFTKQYCAVMDGEKSPLFDKFVTICQKAYNIIRKNGNMFITMFNLMTLTGIPELQSEDDIKYLKNALNSHLTDNEAAKKFKKLIIKSLNTKFVLLNDMIHIMVH